MIRAGWPLVLVTACSTASSPKLDSGASADAAPDATDAPTIDALPDALVPYRHTVAIDGVDDFTVGEQFPTTSASYGARVTWDDQNIYVGYMGADLNPLAADAGTKWLFVYIDTDPQATTATGATQSQTYNTQHATFPTGFGAEYYARRKCDGSLGSIEHYGGGVTWTTAATLPMAQAGTFVELAIPRSVIGTSTSLGLVAYMVNEKQNAEGNYAGLYTGTFVDGYAANLAITKYLRIDLTATRAPNDAANQAP